ncbi:alpha/beta fold hydrolase [Streptoalloteichus hindustanus]|uniref:Alpha/beta hydrolase fold n=1 Tax=Streptoalloteichus hindustanus TaxID=2017 RepID=A0A1M4YTI2_STRHI|nr:alpha/beta hydrolase [Streptoalloteichus hindustanus]SHF09080.1 alpha/beta hydrolase fold [Streptoalloteichus hindustanus]
MTGQLGRFANAQVEQRFLVAYDRAMAAWPVERYSFDVDTAFGRSHVHRCGRASGTPVVLLSTQVVSPAVWAKNVAVFAERRPVFAVEILGGAGRGVQTAPIRGAEDTARWLDEVLARTGLGRVHLVGTTYGGWVALNHALRRPDRVASLSLLNPVHLLRLRRSFFLGLAGISRMLWAARSDAARRRLLAEGVDDEPNSPLVEASVLAVYRYRAEILPTAYPTDGELRAMAAPTLVLCSGGNGKYGARAVDRVRALVPSVEADVVAEHSKVVSAEVVNARVPSFIDGVEARWPR